MRSHDRVTPGEHAVVIEAEPTADRVEHVVDRPSSPFCRASWGLPIRVLPDSKTTVAFGLLLGHVQDGT